MRDLIRSRITFVWLLLVGATLLSWELGHGLGVHDARVAGSLILAVAMIKVRFVVLDFMEIRHAPAWLRAAAEIWTVLLATLLVALFVRSGS
ncbi:MAG: cytochrome C oxidase subunit IV family protein [Panacagrimonas sp.]